MAVAPLLAPAGVEMRVVSQAASFTWGSWSVSWPEGFEPPDPPAEDRELGWVADLGGTEVEPFGRCFVRADAQIDATLGRSNVEDVLDAAKYRTSGEVFLETEIPFENLAGQLPYRDFDVNSLVPTRVGGRILENQLVTKVEESEDEQGNRTATTYIGGQKFQDREALRTRNREIDRVIAQERLERGDEIGARLAASQEYEREQRDNLKEYVDRRDGEVTEHADTAASTAEDNAKQHAEDEDKKLKRGVELIIGPEGSLTRQLQSLNEDYTAKLGENGSVIEDQAAHQRMLSGIVYGTPVTELEGTAFQAQQQAINEMNDVFRNRQTSINKGFDYLFGLNEKINLAQDYNIAHNRITAEGMEAQSPSFETRGLTKIVDQYGSGFVEFTGSVEALRPNRLLVEMAGDDSYSGTALVTALQGNRVLNKMIAYVQTVAGSSGRGNVLDIIVMRDDFIDVFREGKADGCRVWLSLVPGRLPVRAEAKLEALAAEYRKKGLRV